MPRKIGYGSFTPARQAALRKAQLESARKRRKFHHETRHVRRRKKSEDLQVRKSHRKRNIALGAAAVGAVAVAGTIAYRHNQNQNQQTTGTRENPLSFDTSTEKGKKQAISYGRSLTKQTREEWSKTPEGAKQFAAIRAYTSEMHDMYMGKIMRGQELPDYFTDTLKQKMQENIDLIESAFDSENITPMPSWTQVSRGSTLSEFQSGDDPELNQLIDNVKGLAKKHAEFTGYADNYGVTEKEVSALKEKMVGKTFTNKSFTSTSLSLRPAFPNRPVHIRYKIPPGTRGMYVADNMSGVESETDNLLSKFRSEREILFRKNLSYKVTDIKLADAGRIIVEVEGLL